MTTEKGTDINTRKISQQTRYIIVRDEFIPEYECSHPLCGTMHKRWHKRDVRNGLYCTKPVGKVVVYLIIDTQTDDRLTDYYDSYERKREAVADLERFLRRLTDAEWQQIAGA